MHVCAFRELCDIGDIGKLTREQFALALYLINLKMTKGLDPPQSLSPEMIPPSDRQNIKQVSLRVCFFLFLCIYVCVYMYEYAYNTCVTCLSCLVFWLTLTQFLLTIVSLFFLMVCVVYFYYKLAAVCFFFPLCSSFCIALYFVTFWLLQVQLTFCWVSVFGCSEFSASHSFSKSCLWCHLLKLSPSFCLCLGIFQNCNCQKTSRMLSHFPLSFTLSK